MGGFPFDDPTTADQQQQQHSPQVEPQLPIPPEEIDAIARLREEQAASLEQHSQFAQGLQQQQSLVNARAADVDIAERLMQAFDPQLPKSYRDFTLRGLARHMGVDPKGDQFKELSKMAMGLDPDSSAAVRTGIANKIGDSAPGEVRQFISGVLKGQVDGRQLLALTTAANQPVGGPAGDAEEPDAPPGMLTSRANLGGEPTEVAEAAPAGAPPTTPDSRVRPGLRITAPELGAILGYDPASPMRNEEISRTHPNIPTSEAEQRKLATEMQTQDTGILSALIRAAKVEAMAAEGGPMAMSNPEITVPGIGSGRPPTTANILTWMMNTVKGHREIINEGRREPIIGKPGDETKPSPVTPLPVPEGRVAPEAVAPNQEDPNAPPLDAERLNGRERFLARRMASGMIEALPQETVAEAILGPDERGQPPSFAERVRRADRLNRLMEAETSELLVDLGRTHGGANLGRLTDRDLAIIARRLGQEGGNPETLREVLSQTIGNAVRNRDLMIANRTGGSAPLNMGSLTLEDAQLILDAPTTPPSLRPAIEARIAQLQGPAAAPGQPPAATPPAAPGQPPPAAAGPPSDVPGITVAPVDPRAPVPRDPTPPTLDSLPPTERQRTIRNSVLEEEAAARRRAQEDRDEQNRQRKRLADQAARAEETQGMNRESHRRAGEAAERAAEAHQSGTPYQRHLEARRDRERAEDKAERQRKEIAAAFAAAARALSRGGGGGGGGMIASPSGGDDPNAFKMGVIQRRQGPTPGQARKKARIDN